MLSEDPRLAEIDALETEAGELDIPMGGTAHLVVLALADAFDKGDPLEWFVATIARWVPEEGAGWWSGLDKGDLLLLDLLSIDLESSTQLPHIRRAVEIAARIDLLSQSLDADRAMGSPPY